MTDDTYEPYGHSDNWYDDWTDYGMWTGDWSWYQDPWSTQETASADAAGDAF